MPNSSPPFTATRELPPYLGVMAVDAKGFTSQPGTAHEALSGKIPDLVREALHRCGLEGLWDDPPSFGPSGDGFAIGVPTGVLPALVHPVLAEIQHVLTQYNRNITRYEPEIRLRVSLHVGPVSIDPARGTAATGNGTTRNDTHRLLDSIPVKAMLAGASADVTHVAAILSDRLFQDVVMDGFTERHPDHFIPVTAVVPDKNYQRSAWIYVPEPSGSLLEAGVPTVDDTGAGRTTDNPSPSPLAQLRKAQPSSTQVHTNHGQVAGTVEGSMIFGTGGRRD